MSGFLRFPVIRHRFCGCAYELSTSYQDAYLKLSRCYIRLCQSAKILFRSDGLQVKEVQLRFFLLYTQAISQVTFICNSVFLCQYFRRHTSSGIQIEGYWWLFPVSLGLKFPFQCTCDIWKDPHSGSSECNLANVCNVSHSFIIHCVKCISNKTLACSDAVFFYFRGKDF